MYDVAGAQHVERVVAWDPTGKYIEGDILEGRAAQDVVARRAATLPVSKDIVAKGAICGYMRAGYGHGWQFDPVLSRRGAPTVLYIVPGIPFVNWCARVQVVEKDSPVTGQLRFMADSGQLGTISGGLRNEDDPIDFGSLTSPDANGGWTISGRSTYTSQYQGVAGFGLYGALRNARVMWCAVTQTAT